MKKNKKWKKAGKQVIVIKDLNQLDEPYVIENVWTAIKSQTNNAVNIKIEIHISTK